MMWSQRCAGALDATGTLLRRTISKSACGGRAARGTRAASCCCASVAASRRLPRIMASVDELPAQADHETRAVGRCARGVERERDGWQDGHGARQPKPEAERKRSEPPAAATKLLVTRFGYARLRLHCGIGCPDGECGRRHELPPPGRVEQIAHTQRAGERPLREVPGDPLCLVGTGGFVERQHGTER